MFDFNFAQFRINLSHDSMMFTMTFFHSCCTPFVFMKVVVYYYVNRFLWFNTFSINKILNCVGKIATKSNTDNYCNIIQFHNSLSVLYFNGMVRKNEYAMIEIGENSNQESFDATHVNDIMTILIFHITYYNDVRYGTCRVGSIVRFNYERLTFVTVASRGLRIS